MRAILTQRGRNQSLRPVSVKQYYYLYLSSFYATKILDKKKTYLYRIIFLDDIIGDNVLVLTINYITYFESRNYI
jgi:cephalosporin-C deacetylase-like acetyl esterase